jgi:DNA-binding NarL/FixJ family response regulator
VAIRVLIADDYPFIRVGVRTQLSSCDDIEVVGEAANGTDAVQQAEVLFPNVLILDGQMPGLETAKVIQYVQALAQPVYVLILSAHDDIVSLPRKSGHPDKIEVSYDKTQPHTRVQRTSGEAVVQ